MTMKHCMTLLILLKLLGLAQAEPEKIGEILIESKTLGNGLIAMAIQSTNPVADVYLALDAGSGNESHATAGIAHLTEHAMFTGTPTLGPQQFEATVRSWGGRANAYTRDDYTMYYDIGIPTNKLARLLAMEADRLLNLSFEEDAFLFEREQLRAEEADTTTLQAEISAIVDNLAYPDDPYGAGLLHKKHTRGPWLERHEVQRFYKQHYHPNRVTLVVVAPLARSDVLAMIEVAFGHLPAGPATLSRFSPRLPSHSRAIEMALPLNAPHHEAVFRLPPYRPNAAPIDLLLDILSRRAVALDTAPRLEATNRRRGGLLRISANTPATIDAFLEQTLPAPISSNELQTAKARSQHTYVDLPLHTRPYFSLAAELANGSPALTYKAEIEQATLDDLQAIQKALVHPLRITFRPDGSLQTDPLPENSADLADYADRAQAGGRLDDAIRAYTRMFELTQSHMYKVIYLTTRGQLNLEAKHYQEAVNDFRQALEISDYPAIKPLLADAEDQLARQMTRPEASSAPASAPVAVPKEDEETRDQKAELRRLIPEICEEIELWRGLAFKQAVNVTFTNVTESKDLAGYYSSETKQLVVKIHRGRPRFTRGVLLHELVHALQDQHFDLKRLHETAPGADAQHALSSLIEGEAILAVADIMKYNFAAHSDLTSAKGPMDAARFQKLFTYGCGFHFVKHLRSEGGWAAVNKAWTAPPQRSADILDPASYTPQTRIASDASAGLWELIELLATPEATRSQSLDFNEGLLHAERTEDGTLRFSHEKAAEIEALLTPHRPLTRDGQELIIPPQ